MRKDAPDKRSFLLECSDGVIRRITGYRGSYGDFEHRGLPVEDSRLLVNVVFSPNLGRLLDPFAGVGGIVIEAKKAGWETWSIDIDPSLRHGLAKLSDHHLVASSNKLPLDNAVIDAIATEPPYHSGACEVVTKAVSELHRVLKPGGRIAILAAKKQAKMLQKAADPVGFDLNISTPINRKGTDVVCLCWKR
ncbi:TRM11 family SAM-dependent methyltransferase [Thermodesulfobacteriota bacterium]